MRRRPALRWPRRVLAVLLCGSGLAAASAAELGSVGDFDVRLDTTVRTSLGVRVEGQSGAVVSNPNGDDGDRAFKPGLVSERVDVTTRLDVTRGDLGFELGADGWYDAAYQTRNADRWASTFNPISVPVGTFPADTRRLMGETAELSTAYVHDKLDVAGVPVTVSVGRQTVLWGESQFFARDGIAAAQAPVDVIKQIGQPLVSAQEVFLPVAQADIRVALPHGLSLEAYDQFEWRRDRTPGVASYFSTSDVLDVGGETAFAPGGVLYRRPDRTPAGVGQFGVALRRTSDVLDLGAYAIRYNAKEPQFSTAGLPASTYQAVFPRGIELLGVSASTYLGDDTLRGELSDRWHMPLLSRGLGAGSAGGFPGIGSPYGLAPSGAAAAAEAVAAAPAQAGYATGESLQALASYERQLPPGRLWDAALLDAEFVATGLLRVEAQPQYRLPGTTRLATAFEAVFTPRYFQVRPGLDVTVPVGVGLGLSGRSSVDSGIAAGTGSVTLSVAATYRTVWDGSVSYTHFIGAPPLQPLADRDFVMVAISRTF
jgi:hypothetical protein